ncbi:MAG: glycosyltransferase [Sphingobacteriaceae bacterium]
MKRLLIISPYFPPSNAADMQRVRMSLPFFAEFGWLPEVVTVDPAYADLVQDELLLKSIPENIPIYYVKALPKKWTSKLGLGSLALRSLYYYRQKVDRLLKENQFDLIYFSTTQFPVCILGAHWKRKYGVPYVIDMQDPWHSDYYQNKPKNERPPKYWFSYRLNKYLEPLAMKAVSGLISVSDGYIHTLKERYPAIRNIPTAVITFGAFEKDMEIAETHQHQLKTGFQEDPELFHIVYVGRGGYDMQAAVRLLCAGFKLGLTQQPALFKKLRFHFIGTSYAPGGKGIPTLLPIAEEYGLSPYMEEQTDRISFYRSIRTLQAADALVVIGSDDPQYTASKIYPYILAEKPLLAIFDSSSSAADIIQNSNAGKVVILNDPENAIPEIHLFLLALLNDSAAETKINWSNFNEFSARSMTKRQCDLFLKII